MKILKFDSNKQFRVEEGICYDLPSDHYHGKIEGYSSSQVKDANHDIELFYDKHVAKTVVREERSVFDTGTAFHTAILEPEKYSKEIICYKGKRIGKVWEAFKSHNPKKIIISKSQQSQVDTLVQAVKESPVAQAKLSRGTVEVSAFICIYVANGDIYLPSRKWVLGKYGWEQAKAKMPTGGVNIWIKARADKVTIGDKKRYILDLKSMSGNVKDKHEIKAKVSGLGYDLSVALYLDIFTGVTGEKYHDFFWIFASKDKGKSRTYLVSVDNVLIGRAKWKKGILAIANAIKNDWSFDDYVEVLEPNLYEYENIRTKDNGADLL